MAMTIKNDRVVGKVKRLANELGTGQVEAIELAVDRLTTQIKAGGSSLEKRTAEVLELSRSIRDIIDDANLTSTNATDDLYDEWGLPA